MNYLDSAQIAVEVNRYSSDEDDDDERSEFGSSSDPTVNVDALTATTDP